MAKLTREQKIEIYERSLKKEKFQKLALEFNMNVSGVRYLFRLIRIFYS